MPRRRMIADYQIVEKMGAGANGVLFRAVPPARLESERDLVALKVLGHTATSDDFRRFANEIRLFVAADSPYLVTVLDAGHQAGTLFYAMELMEGGSLDDAANRRDRSEGDVAEIVACAARGAHALHEVGVAHRDIKPSNILIGPRASVLSDLGLAQILNPGSLLTGSGPIGPIEFMSPSIARSERATRATDIWALAATFHRVVTGRSVYGDIPTKSVVTAFQHIARTPPTVSDGLSADVRSCLERALAIDGSARYRTAAEFAEELEELT